jgi:putative sterol carrier protein
MTEMTVQDFMSRMAGAFQPEKAVGLDASIQLKLTGAQPGEWLVLIKDGKCTVEQGSTPTARLTVTADSGDFMKIFTGQLDGMQAFMQGKLKLTGDMSVAMKLMSLFKVQ